ncbi:uncharacterized protein LOC129598211 isoform X2 [Paramacrobiotus metropolitanus]|uniref:uncharacterized protein LOC129598211 isoform X2 n=1 Tax=Paramacrobiotus metropolitanus TaxID=2943436 RepID=UPI00244622BA|nr:uncharacterized protein LOC129598211 isoform X2 [Paramacrobiotus metropolitanus]
MFPKSALVYWFVDAKPRCGTVDHHRLRKWELFQMELEEGNACEALWSKGKWIPCIILRFDETRDAKALENRYLADQSDIDREDSNGRDAAENVAQKCGVTLQDMRKKYIDSLARPLKAGARGRKTTVPKEPATNSQRAAPTPALAPASTRLPAMPPLLVPAVNPAAPVIRAPDATTPSSVAVLPSVPVQRIAVHAEAHHARVEGSTLSASGESAEAAAHQRNVGQQTLFRERTPELAQRIDVLSTDMLKLKKEVTHLKDQNSQLVADNLKLGKQLQSLESRVASKSRESAEDKDLLDKMKQHTQVPYAIKAGLLHFFKEEELVYECLVSWCAFRNKPELTDDKFRKKVTTCLETAKCNHKAAIKRLEGSGGSNDASMDTGDSLML